MAVRKTHVKSDKRIKREKEQREAAASSAKRQHRKHRLGSKKQTTVDTRFKVSTALQLCCFDHPADQLACYSSKVKLNGTRISLWT